MKTLILQMPYGKWIEVVENPLLAKPWAGADGIISFWQFYNQKTKKYYVGNIYQLIFSMTKWDISNGAIICANVAQNHLNQLIDKM